MTGSAAAMILRFLSSCRPTPSRITTDMNRFTNRQSSVTWCASDELIIRVSAYLSPCQEVVYIRDLEIGEVEHAVLHVFIHQLADVPHKPFRIDHWRRRLRRALHEQTARFVAVALRQSDENVDEVSLLGFFELVYEAGVEENELGMVFAEAK